MDAIFHSFGLVLLSEMGDKTQLLALVLALRYKQTWPVLAGILVATVLNHGLATWLGFWAASQISEELLRAVLALLFFAFAIWILVPDKLDGEEQRIYKRQSAFWATLVLFFLAEMGDKTQLATLALGAKFQQPLAVTIGSTLGMMVANGLAIVFSEKLTKIFPMKAIRIVSSILFLIFGLAILYKWI
ncbi:MAG: TMEM165/GDT1 family protein [Oligoflexales bacterium]|nr:TMEM165/GDT1 family protein [Oligoflexales bacterium]